MAGSYKATAGSGSCTLCVSGSYKETSGPGSCAPCPSHTSSASGSEELTDCECVAGYTVVVGVECRACDAGMFKSVKGSAECQICPANSESAVGSAICYCSPGFAGNDGGACAACSDCTKVVVFTATVDMTLAESLWDGLLYVAGVAQALSLAPTCVKISTVDQYTSRRRSTVTSIEVGTTVTVAPTPHTACRAVNPHL